MDDLPPPHPSPSSSSSPTEALAAVLTYLLTPSPAVFAVGLAVVLLFPVALHLFLTRATPYAALPSVLLAGPSGAGKTALLTLLERRAPVAPRDEVAGNLTHTSQTPVAVELAVSAEEGGPPGGGKGSYRDDLDANASKAKKFLLVDTPGHGKLRHFAMSRLYSSFAGKKNNGGGGGNKGQHGSGPDAGVGAGNRLKAVIFVVDAAALGDSGSEALAAAASYLYEVLMSLQKRMGSGRSSRAPHAVPVLVAANKSDLFTALPAALVRSSLENELGRIRRTRSKGLLDSGVGSDEIDRAEEADDWLGEYGSDKFAFGQMREFDVEVDVIGGSVIGGQGKGLGVDAWWDWIADKL